MRLVNKISLSLLAFISVVAAQAQKSFSTNPYPIFPSGISSTVQFKVLPGDFNHDGKPDVFAYGDVPNTDSALILNNGSGLLNAIGGSIPYTGAKGYVQTGDLNGDGAIDLAVCSLVQNSNQWTLSTLINDGTGKFTVDSSINLAGTCSSVSIGDANRDGKLDVVVTQYTGAGAPYNNMITTFYGDGTGKVGSPVTQQNINLDSSSSSSTTNCAVTDATAGDFYGDGNLSLLLNSTCHPAQGGTTPAGTSFFAHSLGNGQFTLSELMAGNEVLSDGKTFDVNRDGKPDAVFISTSSGTSNLYYAQNNGSGSFTFNKLTGVLALAGSVSQFDGVTVGDFNGDGYNDIAATYMTGSGAQANSYVSILNGSGTGTFTESQHWLVGDGTTTLLADIASADFNGDGKPDLVLTYQSPANGDVSLLEYLNTPGTDSCAVPATQHTGVICTPASGSTISSPFTITAASNEPGFTLNRFYLDGNVFYQTVTQSVSYYAAASPGTHQLTMVSYSNQGGALTTTSTFNVTAGSPGPGSPCVPTGTGVRICSPLSGSSVTSAVTVTAGAIAGSGNITAIRVYSNNVSLGTFYNSAPTNSFSINQPFLIEPGAHTLTLVAYESTGGTQTGSTSIVSSGATGCATAAIPLRICFPAANATVPTTFAIGAGATAQAAGITGIRAYIDDVQAFFVASNSNAAAFETQREVTTTPGTHHLVVVAYQGSQPALTTQEYFTAVSGTPQGPCAPSTQGALICSPSPNATVTSPVQISAGATTSNGYLAAMRVYVDNVSQVTINNPQQTKSFSISPSLTMSPGTHSIVVVGYPSTGGSLTASENITVQ